MKDFNKPAATQGLPGLVATTPWHRQSLRPLVVLAITALFVGCGGGNERGEGNEGNENRTTATFTTTTTTTSTATPSAASIANGKVLYAQNCFSCHGANIAAAKNSNNTLNAIASNKGGMGILTTKITSSQADDIAAYLSFGL